MHKPDPWQVPTPDGNQRPVSMQQNTHLPGDVSQDDKGTLMRVASEIVDGNSNRLHRFLNGVRQQHSLSGRNYSQAHFEAEQMKARWSINNGFERMIMDVYPTHHAGGGESTSEKNLDGYIAWIHAQPGYPDGSQYVPLFECGPFTLILNGYVIEPLWQPRQYFGDGNASFYAMLFGKTALMANSMSDKRNPLLKNGAMKKPLRLIPGSSGTVAAGVECNGMEQPAHAETLGYWVFDWQNIFNPCSFIYNSGFGRGYRWNQVSYGDANGWAWDLISGTPHLGDLSFGGGIYFPNVDKEGTKSPLMALGTNNVGTMPGPGSPQYGSIVPCVDLFVAEFYDRGKFTTLSQSWTVPAKANRSIAATNKPLLFGTLDYQVGYNTGNGSNMKISLDPQDTKEPTSDSNPAFMRPHDYFTVDTFGHYGNGPGDALTDEEKRKLEDWRLANKNIYDPWAKKLIDDYTVLYNELSDTTFQDKVAEAHLIAAVLRLYRGNIFQFTTGIYEYWKSDPLGYATNTYDPNYLEHPVYPTWATSGTILSDNNYDIHIEGGYYEIHDPPSGRVYYPNTVGGKQENVLIIPKFRDQSKPGNTVVEYARLVSNGVNSFVDISKDAYTTVDNGSTYIDLPNYHEEHALYRVVPIDYSTYVNDSAHYWVLGPGLLSGMMPTLEAFLMTTMTEYDRIMRGLEEIKTRKPPTPLPIPNLGKDLSEFAYSKVDRDWNFNQNP